MNIQVDQIENLPTLPSVYSEVERLCQNPDVDSEELSKVIQTDPSITLKLVRLANSAFFGFTRKVNSVKDAISLLGNQTAKNAVLSISIYEATKGRRFQPGWIKRSSGSILSESVPLRGLWPINWGSRGKRSLRRESSTI